MDMQANPAASAATDAPITAVLVPEALRLGVLPRFFGRSMTLAECRVYDWMAALCSTYRGGYWHYYELSNGGFYMAPECSERMRLAVQGNGFDGAMSADAAGVVACLFAFCQLAGKEDRFIDLYHQLRDFVGDHPESRSIFRAID